MAPGTGRPTPDGQAVPVVSRKYTVLTPFPPLPLVKYRTLLYSVSPRKLSSLPILSGLSPSWVTLKLPTGVGGPGFSAASGARAGPRPGSG